MIFRKVVEADFFQIKKLYKERFNLNLKKNIYNYFYFDQNLNNYCSIIAEDKSKIVAHHAIIQNKYLFKNKNIIIGYSSGSIVSKGYFGLYPYILKKSIENFRGDLIITFPNKGSQGFFTKIFNFETIEQNYFSINYLKIEYVKALKDIECKSNFIRTKEYISWRIDKHPITIYKIFFLDKTRVIYKENNLNEINIMCVNYFNDEFIKILIKLLKDYKKINIIHWDRNYIKKIGFKEQKYHIFVYKNISNKIDIPIFECQMIDSDVF